MIKNYINHLLLFLPQSLRIKIKFFLRLGYWPDLNNPITFNERINHRKINANNELFNICADKLAVRDYIADKIGSEYLIPLVYKGDSVTAEQLKAFGKDIIVKATHDSGNVFIIKDSSADYVGIARKVNKSLLFDFGRRADEPWYSKIDAKIIVEKLLKKADGSQPEDYKFHVFNCHDGAEIILQIDYDRFNGHNRTFYSRDGVVLDFGLKHKNLYRSLPNIENLELMFDLALKAANDFDYVRVDFYNVEGVIYFGELTFAHGTGFERFSKREQDRVWGNYWKKATR
ncbi:hypothetical protein MN202_15230 [Rheinheimera muenzenbergensis]|uniref:TupA-like ATPgrasp n=1 Tax=Rheinheimera muenzenbergensis TaxID=1193628 RepID=A0ABU8C9H2_9GAMM